MLPFWQAKKLCQVSLSAIILKKKRFSVRHYVVGRVWQDAYMYLKSYKKNILE
jgi:hypothetical protein